MKKLFIFKYSFANNFSCCIILKKVKKQGDLNDNSR